MPGGMDYLPHNFVGRIADPRVYTHGVNMGFSPHVYSATCADAWLVVTNSATTSTIPLTDCAYTIAGTWLGAGSRTTFIIITDLIDGSHNGFIEVIQQGCANYSVSPASVSLAAGAFPAQTFSVISNQGLDGLQAPASWTATCPDAWVTLTAFTGSGIGTVFCHFDVAANVGAARTSVITIHGAYNCGADPTFTINQAAGTGGSPGGPGDGLSGTHTRTMYLRQRSAGLAVVASSSAQVMLARSKDLGLSLGTRITYMSIVLESHDAVLDGTDALLVATANAGAIKATRCAQLMGGFATTVVAASLVGTTPVWLKTPERALYLFTGGPVGGAGTSGGYRYDADTQVMTAETAYAGLAGLADFWTWAWRGDELWIAQDSGTPGTPTIRKTRDRGRSFGGASTPAPLAGINALHPRIVIDRTGVAFLAYWDGGTAEIMAMASADGLVTWSTPRLVSAAPEQWPGGVSIDQKMLLSFVDNSGVLESANFFDILA